MTIFSRASSLPALALAMAFSCATPVLAQTAPAPAAPQTTATPAADGVVARVDGIEIRQSDLNAAEDDIGAATARMNDAQKRDYLIGFVTDLMLTAKAAEAQKLQDDPEFRQKLDYTRRKLLAEALLSKETRAKATEEEMRKVYDEEIKKIPAEDEVNARHILVEKEEEAKDIVAKLKAGGDFVALAKEMSKDPGSKTDGGSLGFFTKSQMVPEFSDAAFALKPGEVSAPVKSQFGWHVIKVEERRAKQPPAFEQVKGQIEEYLSRKAHSDLITSLRANAKIERVGEAAPAPAPATPAVPAEQPKKK